MAAELCLGLGEILWDEFTASGKTVRHLGGAPCNFAFHARSLGARGEILSAVGDDDLGRSILNKLTHAGFDPSCVSVDPQHSTGRVVVEQQPDQTPRYTIVEDAAWDHLAPTAASRALCAKAQALCFGSLAQRSDTTRQSIRLLLALAPASSLRIFDTNLRQHFYSAEILETSLTLSTVAKISDEELPKVARLLELPGGPREFAQGLLKRHPLRLVAITRGGRGSLLIGPEGVNEHPGVSSRTLDTVGAGDSFTACLAVGLLRGLPLPRLHDAANRVAAYVCSQPGATPALPADLVRLLDG